ncbi:hypothetical protein VO64_2758 [Pseudomonas synxantha]|uniref:Uncharacterized protein n=1 Tax=Pseudomonas synxantha TaxID=47883 RepID=A0AAU8TS38_9PSED|nr:hypothetical protein VO64_2758 [Pseudomonas synxantha]
MQVIQRRTLSHGFLLPGLAKVRRAATCAEHPELQGPQAHTAGRPERRSAPNAAHCSLKL